MMRHFRSDTREETKKSLASVRSQRPRSSSVGGDGGQGYDVILGFRFHRNVSHSSKGRHRCYTPILNVCTPDLACPHVRDSLRLPLDQQSRDIAYQPNAYNMRKTSKLLVDHVENVHWKNNSASAASSVVPGTSCFF